MARTLGNEPIGNIVKLSFNGGLREFIVIHHGKPSEDYGSGFDGGTILLMKDIYSTMIWTTAWSAATYLDSHVYPTLSGIFSLFGAEIKNDIRTVVIPYQASHSSKYPKKGANGLPSQLFLLSAKELGRIPVPSDGWSTSDDGTLLSYAATGQSKAGYYNGIATLWWLRSINVIYKSGSDDYLHRPWATFVDIAGNVNRAGDGNTGLVGGVRPALVLPDTLYVSDSNNEVTRNLPPSAPTGINLPMSIKGGGTTEITWGNSTDPDGNLSGYRLERSVNSSAFSQIYQGNMLTYTDTITYGWNTVAYRVRAYDSIGAVSGYTASPTRTIFNNSAPTAPPSLTIPNEIKGGKVHIISWGAATDVDGNLSGYQLERSVNGAAFAEIYKGPDRTRSDTVIKGSTSVAYRVRAYDTENAWSAYTTSATRTVINNTPPSISGVDSSLGTKNETFSVAYSVSDPDGDAITVTEKLDDKVLRTFTAIANKEYQISLDAAAFRQIPNGQHKLTVTATDAPGESVVRTWTWTKNMTQVCVTMKTPIQITNKPYKCLLHINAAIPTGALLTVKVCNNALDESPIWEECTEDARSGQVIFIANAQKTSAKWAFNFQIQLKRSGASGDCYITGVSGNFEEEGS